MTSGTYPGNVAIVAVLVGSGGLVGFDLGDDFTFFNGIAFLFLPFLNGADFHGGREGGHVDEFVLWEGG